MFEHFSLGAVVILLGWSSAIHPGTGNHCAESFHGVWCIVRKNFFPAEAPEPELVEGLGLLVWTLGSRGCSRSVDNKFK